MMKSTVTKPWLRPLLFTLTGAGSGLAYYYLIGCTSGSCPITANPISTALYAAVFGYVLSGIFSKECERECNM